MKVASVSHSVIGVDPGQQQRRAGAAQQRREDQRLRVGELALGGGAPGGARHAAVDLLLHQAVERGRGGGHQPDARGGGQRGHQRRPAGHGQEHADDRAEHDQLHHARLGQRVVLAPARRLGAAGAGLGTGTELMTRGRFSCSGRRPLRSRCRPPAPRPRQCAPARPPAASRARHSTGPVANWSTTRPPMMTARRRAVGAASSKAAPTSQPIAATNTTANRRCVHWIATSAVIAIGAPSAAAAQLAREREALGPVHRRPPLAVALRKAGAGEHGVVGADPAAEGDLQQQRERGQPQAPRGRARRAARRPRARRACTDSSASRPMPPSRWPVTMAG